MVMLVRNLAKLYIHRGSSGKVVTVWLQRTMSENLSPAVHKLVFYLFLTGQSGHEHLLSPPFS